VLCSKFQTYINVLSFEIKNLAKIVDQGYRITHHIAQTKILKINAYEPLGIKNQTLNKLFEEFRLFSQQI
jgi:DNA-directed RNA polymerase subunit L